MGWQYWGEIELRSKFWGKSVEMMPTGQYGFLSPTPLQILRMAKCRILVHSHVRRIIFSA